jgi:general secretion pathway protein C
MVTLADNRHLTTILARLPPVTNGALIVLIAYLAATLTWKWLAPPPTDQARPPHPRSPLASAARRTQAVRYDTRIAKLHLFGQSDAPQAQAALEAPETRLNLTLRGVYAAPGEDAMAIIAAGGGNEKLYRVGNTIAGGATLKAVYRNRVILQRGARMETLSLPKGEAGGIAITRASPSPGAPGRAAAGARLNDIRSEVLQHPEKLGKMVQAVPARENGQFLGYRLSPRNNARLFGELGLENGDIVTAVNGVMIDRPDKGLRALQTLAEAEDITLTLLRDGNEITVHHSMGP